MCGVGSDDIGKQHGHSKTHNSDLRMGHYRIPYSSVSERRKQTNKKKLLCFYMERESEERFKPGEVVKSATDGADKSY